MLSANSVLRGPRSLFINPDIVLPLRVVKLAHTGLCHPSQWEGWTDTDRLILVRFRYGRLWIGLTADFMTTPITLLETGYGCLDDGYLAFKTLQKRTVGVVDWPRGRQPRWLTRPRASQRRRPQPRS
jgi:hypothetical protein